MLDNVYMQMVVVIVYMVARSIMPVLLLPNDVARRAERFIL